MRAVEFSVYPHSDRSPMNSMDSPRDKRYRQLKEVGNDELIRMLPERDVEYSPHFEKSSPNLRFSFRRVSTDGRNTLYTISRSQSVEVQRASFMDSSKRSKSGTKHRLRKLFNRLRCLFKRT